MMSATEIHQGAAKSIIYHRQVGNPGTTVAVIPAHNEDRFIGSLVIKVRRYVDTVVVVDDGSTDTTAEVARAAGAIVVRHEVNRGKGEALNTGFRKARELGAAAVVILDGDGQHQPEDIATVIEPVVGGRADMAVGSRFIGAGNHIPWWRVIGQRALTLATNLTSGMPLSDSQSGFRAFSRRAIDELFFHENGFSVESEMQFRARERNLIVVEVPIRCLYTEKPKRNPFWHGLEVLNGILRLVGQIRPLLFFGSAGMLTLLLGLFWGWKVVEIYAHIGTLAIGYALITVLLTVIGTLALFAGLILHSIRGFIVELTQAQLGR